MRHLKGFYQLNEAKQDGLEIMDAIINTPEGKDLTAAISIPGLTVADLFEPKNTGRVWIRGTYGSKSYIEKINGVYSLISLSNGKIFAQEDYNTIKECLRRAWSNAIGKKSTSIGIKKKDYREWLETNIEPGQELTPDEILLIYKEEAGVEMPILSEIINNSSVIPIIEAMFPNSRIPKETGGRNNNEAILALSFYNSPLLFCDSEIPYPYNQQVTYNLGIRIKMKVQKSSKLTNKSGSYIIEIGTVDSVNNFDRLLREWLTGAVLGLKDNSNHIYKTLKRNLFSICPLLEQSMIALFSEANINLVDQESIWDKIADTIIAKGEPNLISKAKNNIPQLWDKIEKKMGGKKADTASKLGDLGF